MKPTGLLAAFVAMNTPNDARPVFRLAGLDGWICNGYCAAFVGDEAASVPERKTLPASALTDMFALPRTELVEDVPSRIPFVPANSPPPAKCDACDGNGTVTCDYDEDHECRDCSGKGHDGPNPGRDKPGQRVYRDRSGAGLVFVSDQCGALFEGLAVVRLGTGERDPVAGIDEHGDLVALAMPMQGEPGKPDVSP